MSATYEHILTEILYKAKRDGLTVDGEGFRAWLGRQEFANHAARKYDMTMSDVAAELRRWENSEPLQFNQHTGSSGGMHTLATAFLADLDE